MLVCHEEHNGCLAASADLQHLADLEESFGRKPPAMQHRNLRKDGKRKNIFSDKNHAKRVPYGKKSSFCEEIPLLV